ncbi:hypothetical protein SLE2022_225990 [Rubroshorea leprosula]
MNTFRSSLIKSIGSQESRIFPSSFSCLAALKPPQNHIFLSHSTVATNFYQSTSLRQLGSLCRSFSTRPSQYLFLDRYLPMRKRIRPPANKGINYFGKNRAYVIESDRKYLKTLNFGIHLLNPSTKDCLRAFP